MTDLKNCWMICPARSEESMESINIKTRQNEYEVRVGKGYRSSIPEMIMQTYPKSKFAIITDDNVKNLYADEFIKQFLELGKGCEVISIKPGEKSKSLAEFGRICSFLADKNFNRADVIIALGGGVVGDLAGYAASAFLRGVTYIQVPTTLLSQIDSSVGGKTAINIPEGKNLVGAFYHPSAVYIDMDFLKTLKAEDFADGMAELIKYALIKDEQMFRQLELHDKIDAHSQILQELVVKCLKIKRDVVMADELDKGERMKLNFGHTIGHGLERLAARSGLHITHGQGVARGMAAITAASERMGQTQIGTTQRIISVLNKQELPTTISEFSKEDILKGILVDKKNIADKINLILIEKPGKSFIYPVSSSKAEEYIG